MNQTRNITLIGMPGAGKTTVGKLLAKKLSYHFIDTDHILEKKQGKTLSAILKQYGTEGFCRLEEEHVLEVNGDALVIATGGSVVYGQKAMAHLQKISLVVYLAVEPKQLHKRLNDLGARGVVLEDGQDLEALYRVRRPLYERFAHFSAPASHPRPEQTVAMILQQARIRGYFPGLSQTNTNR